MIPRVFALFLIIALPALAAAHEIQIQNWMGQVVVKRKGSPQELKHGFALQAGDTLFTKAGSKVRLEDRKKGLSILQPKSELKVVVDGLKLAHGSLRTETIPYSVSTPVSVHSSAGVSVISYYPLYGKASHQVLAGKADAAALGTTEKKAIAASQSLFFKAHVDEEGPVVDEFLGGRKVIRGQWGSIEAVADVKALSASTHLKAWSPPPPKPKGPVAQPGEICQKPFAQYNTCLYRCQNASGKPVSCAEVGSTCHRKRCNANGEWTEDSRLPASSARHCAGAEPVLAPCGY